MRLASADGTWRIDVIRLDGADRLRVHQHGYFHAEVRTPSELALIVPLADLAEVPAAVGPEGAGLVPAPDRARRTATRVSHWRG